MLTTSTIMTHRRLSMKSSRVFARRCAEAGGAIGRTASIAMSGFITSAPNLVSRNADARIKTCGLLLRFRESKVHMSKNAPVQSIQLDGFARLRKPPNRGLAVPTRNFAHDLVLPTVLFMALGAMVWAVRGSSGFGAVNGCVFAGVTWGVAWWFIAREPAARQSRPYSSGWIILALTVGIGLSGARGWMQWPSFF